MYRTLNRGIMRTKKEFPTTSISVRGDKKFKAKIAMFAAQKNTTVADVTRNALEMAFGKELEELEFFFTDDDTSKYQLLRKGYTIEGGAE